MKNYVISKIEITEARHSTDGKKHKHKYYLYPIPANLKDLGFIANWSYANGKRGAIKIVGKKQAQYIANKVGGNVEEA